MKTFWTTFYSYKGGVGRSLALANVAALLVQRGHRVVLLDFDLEAPGLDTFSEFAGAKRKPGIVEYFAEFQRQQSAPEIASFVYPIRLLEHLRGKLWIMPAGCKDAAYNGLLARINWAELYEAGLGAPFIENWKLSIEQAFQPDYVLIDSRTGLTEIGGVCTTAFPDLVVMLFSLNQQNVDGTATVVRHIREADVGRPVHLHFVATPLPNLQPEKRGLLRKRLVTAEKTLGIKIGKNSIRYWSPAALTERLFVLDDATPQPGFVQDHHTLCDKITEFNRNGLDFLTLQTEQAIETDNVDLAGRLAEALRSEFPSRPEAFFLCSRLARLENRNEDAILLAEKAFTQDPLYEPPFDFLRAHYQRTKQHGRLESMYEELLACSPRLSLSRKHELLYDLGLLQMMIGKPLQASEHFKEVLENQGTDEEQPHFSSIVCEFNAAESARRTGLNVDFSRWQNIIDIFEAFGANEEPFLDSNRLQAMHIPYALTGQIGKARDCLLKAQRIAENVNDFESIFSVRDYRDVSREEFRTDQRPTVSCLGKRRALGRNKTPTQPNQEHRIVSTQS